jgi:uncharacterized protein with GYD domain
MGKYMWQVSYTQEGVKGLMQEGGSSRVQMVEKLLGNLGGRLESMNFAFGDHDAIVIADLPEQSDAAAIAMAVGSAGAATIKTTVLLSPEDVDAAAKKTVDYRPPGK